VTLVLFECHRQSSFLYSVKRISYSISRTEIEYATEKLTVRWRPSFTDDIQAVLILSMKHN